MSKEAENTTQVNERIRKVRKTGELLHHFALSIFDQPTPSKKQMEQLERIIQGHNNVHKVLLPLSIQANANPKVIKTLYVTEQRLKEITAVRYCHKVLFSSAKVAINADSGLMNLRVAANRRDQLLTHDNKVDKATKKCLEKIFSRAVEYNVNVTKKALKALRPQLNDLKKMHEDIKKLDEKLLKLRTKMPDIADMKKWSKASEEYQRLNRQVALKKSLYIEKHKEFKPTMLALYEAMNASGMYAGRGSLIRETAQKANDLFQEFISLRAFTVESSQRIALDTVDIQPGYNVEGYGVNPLHPANGGPGYAAQGYKADKPAVYDIPDFGIKNNSALVYDIPDFGAQDGKNQYFGEKQEVKPQPEIYANAAGISLQEEMRLLMADESKPAY